MYPHVPKSLLGVVPTPLFHSVHGSSGLWDDVLTLLLVGGVLVVLATLAFRSGKRRGKGKRQ
jgi:hypothetical protein